MPLCTTESNEYYLVSIRTPDSGATRLYYLILPRIESWDI
ncbi:hypothetical protein TOL_2237 [Thalassolituus oleivorans MIL-1]|uniref:Uncharacterized protein n=1 Tax=Thalassolituus oleivorans MIL-1 TaxID=1298593 RepID=M5DRV3_9GAMM|nr:hypothetical protein TOL_2237 [Thalassolituus oleivorans MIL-1]